MMIIPTSIYALQNPAMNTVMKTPEEIALAFIKDSPTFSFDGITSTLKVEDVYINKSNPPQYVVTVGFQCLHSGYGDRTGQMLLQVLTLHSAVVTVIDGKVNRAVIDGIWNEVAQVPMEVKDIKLVVENIALSWLVKAPTYKFDGVDGSAKVVDSWLAMTFAAPSFWGVTIEFDCLHAGYGDRSGEMMAQVITHHVARLHVTDGTVTFAEIDDAWDEYKQKSIEAVYTPEKAEVSALTWLYGCPTFKFDGIPETVKVKEIIPLRMLNAWDVYIDFTCGYPGYGDRTGNVMLGHSQTHTIRITVIEGQVIRATIDDVWDEIEQKLIESNSTILTPEEARDIAVKYVIAKLGLDAAVNEGWIVEDLTPQGLLGVQKTRYTSGDWSVIVENAVVWKPTYTVTVEKKTGETWTGKIDQSGTVVSEETQPSVPHNFYTPDIARKLCLDYLLVSHPEINVQIPIEWVEKNLVPEDIVGITKIQYSSGWWTVTVKAPVVWKPTYNVTITYRSAEGTFTWEGIVPQGGQVQETAFSK